MPIPEYINCNNDEFQHCDYLIHRDCQGTCNFAKELGGMEEILGVGAPMISPNQTQEKTSDRFGNMKYVNGEVNPAYKP